MTAIRSPAAAFTRPVSAVLNANRDGMVAEFVFGGDADTSRRNLAQRGKPATVNGAPTWSANHARFSNNLGQNMDTGVPAAMRDVTMVAVMRSISGVGEAIISPAPITGFILAHANHEWRFNNSITANPPQAASVVLTPGETDFRCGIGWGSFGTISSLSVGQAGIGFNSAVGSQVNAGSRGGQNFVVAPNLGVGNVTFEIAYLALYDRILTARERLEVYLGLRAGLAGRVTVF
ncbi:hypothetical protein D3C71_628320 [compost metagenome]